MTWKIPLLTKLPKVYQRWQNDDGPLMAAAVAYYAALSFFPLLLVLISGLGLLTEYTVWGQDAEKQVLATIADYTTPSVSVNVAEMLGRVQRNAVVGGPLGILTLIFTAAALFAHFEKAFERIWNVESSETKGILGATKNMLFTRLRAFVMLLGIGVLVLAVFIAGIAISSIESWTAGYLPNARWIWWIVGTGVSVTLNTCVFTLLYKLLPKVRVHWSEALRGGLFAAGVWEIARVVLAAVVLGDKYSAYGVVGSFIAVMLWIYIAGSIVFLGAEYIQVICEDCNPQSEGALQGVSP